MYLTTIPRIVRLILAFVVFFFVLAVAVVGTLFYVLDEKTVKSTIEAYAKEALNASVEYEGSVELKHLTSLKVRIPALHFTDLSSGEEIGSIDGAQADVALWSALLGAVNVNSITISGARLTLNVPHANGDSLFDEAFGSVRFPENLRVSQFHLNQAQINLKTGTQETIRSWKISALSLSMGRLSPEMTTPFELSAHFEATENSPQKEITPETITENASDQATSASNSASSTVPSEVPLPASSEVPEAAFETTPESSNVDHPAEGVTIEKTPDIETTEPPSADYIDLPNTPEIPQSSTSTPAEEEQQSVWNLHFIREAFAQEYLTEASETFVSFDPATLSGDLSAKGTLTLSVTDRYVMFEDISFAGEISNKGILWTTVAKADRIRFKGNELSGSNLTAALSQPNDTTGDIHLGAVDFRVRPGILESPEMRFSRTEERGSRVNTFEIASSVRADLSAKTADLDNLAARVSITGDENLPTDFNASVTGFIKADFNRNEAQVGLSGDFAGAPISFNGTVNNATARPTFEGELMIGEINRDTLPGAEILAWMHRFDFSGALRISHITAAGVSATQLHGTLSIKEGKAVIDSLVVNTAEGRLFGTFELSEDTSWLFNGRVDGVSLDKFISPMAGASPVEGISNGDLTLAGKGFAPENLSGTAQLRILRPAYIGLDASAVRSHLVSNTDTALITRQGARTDLDEATLSITLNNNTLSLTDVVARSVYVRTKSEIAIDLSNGTLSGTSSINFAPQQGIPSIHLASTISGNGTSPVWSFDWQKSIAALQRAQGKSVLTEKKEEKSIWQSVKDFFNF